MGKLIFCGNIANLRTRTSFEAQAILYLVQQREFPVVMEQLPLPLPAYTGTLPTIHFKNEVENLPKTIKVYPNPTNGNVMVDVPNTYKNAKIILYSIDGKTMLEEQLLSVNNSLNISYLQTGIYYYAIVFDGTIVEHNKLVMIK